MHEKAAELVDEIKRDTQKDTTQFQNETMIKNNFNLKLRSSQGCLVLGNVLQSRDA